ncbi:FAS1 domain-containing protein [Aspergillus sclerotialis]|uniref:FAS1 domain-containing protein n=1 Tax=Aspergillus sclerotialis TaxID=2070753 RepID=A0A3A2ZP52_9EURO|nr:FAS1 domain-containing protein [Aspergillus sclerotialis]
MRRLVFTQSIFSLFALFYTVSAAWALPSVAAAALRNHLPFTKTLYLNNQDKPRDDTQYIFQNQYQHPVIMDEYPPNTVVPTSTPPPEDIDHQSKSMGPIVADVLPKIKWINIFASLTRDFEDIASRLNDSSRNVTVLAPRNSAIQGLPRKPWENPEDYEAFGEANAYSGSEGEDRARKNLRRFVEAHLIPASPWRKDDEVGTLGGGKLKWYKEGEKIYIHPGGIEVDHIAAQVSNGEVWVLNGVVNYQ